MMKGRRIIAALALLACAAAWGEANPAARIQEPVRDLRGLASLYEKYQQDFLPLLIPSGIYLHAHRNVVPVDLDGFPSLKAHMDLRTGHILRTVYVFEDAKQGNCFYRRRFLRGWPDSAPFLILAVFVG